MLKSCRVYIKTHCFSSVQMTNSVAQNEEVTQPINANDSLSEQSQRTVRRISPRLGILKAVSFESIAPGVLVRLTDDGHLLALDFLSVLSLGDRKKASQILARITSRADYSEMLTLRHVEGKQKTRKLVSFSNAIQLLLTLPKRTVCMETRRAIAGVLTDYFEYQHQQPHESKPVAPNPVSQNDPSVPPDFSLSALLSRPPDNRPLGQSFEPNNRSAPISFGFPGAPFTPFSYYNSEEDRRIAQRQAQINLTRNEMELDRQRAKLPLERLNQCMELMERVGPMSEDEQRKFRSLIAEQAVGVNARAMCP